MTKDAIITTVQRRIEEILSSQPEHFLVDIRIKPTNNIKVFLDGDKGVGIDDLAKYNRALYKKIEEEGLFPDGDFSLELSSAGLDEPLKMHRQYLKNIGRDLQVTLADGAVKEGRLLSVADDEIVIEETAGKPRPQHGKPLAQSKGTVITQSVILFNDIKTTKILIKF